MLRLDCTIHVSFSAGHYNSRRGSCGPSGPCLDCAQGTSLILLYFCFPELLFSLQLKSLVGTHGERLDATALSRNVERAIAVLTWKP